MNVFPFIIREYSSITSSSLGSGVTKNTDTTDIVDGGQGGILGFEPWGGLIPKHDTSK